MQPLLDLAPVLAFFLAYLLRGIYVATAVLMISMVALVLLDLLRHRRVSPMHLISTVLVLGLGGATLVLRDPRFLKWKPSVFFWIVALASAASTWIGGAPITQRLLAPIVPGSAALPRATWLRLNWTSTAFYALLGAANLWVATTFSERIWVYFKFGGLSAALFLFAIGQALWLSARSEALAA
jgi:intracellular septation protein